MKMMLRFLGSLLLALAAVISVGQITQPPGGITGNLSAGLSSNNTFTGTNNFTGTLTASASSTVTINSTNTVTAGAGLVNVGRLGVTTTVRPTNGITAGAGNTTVIAANGAQAALFNGNGRTDIGAVLSTGTKFTTSGCSISATTGGAAAGTFTLGANTCSAVVTINGATGMTATNGWACSASDRTAPTVLISQSASSTTTATFSVPAGAGATDVISFNCTGY